MSFFQMKVGNRFTIVATNGAANGHQPVYKSEATGFDVFDRMNCKTVVRDEPFETAFDFCTLRLAVLSVPRAQ
jgi:hypothetical protein